MVVSRVDVADFSGVKSLQGLGDPLLINRALAQEQVHGSRLVRIEAQQPADALGGLALVAEGIPDDTYPQIRDANALRELGHAGQALDVARVEQVQVGLAVLVLGVVGVRGLHFGLLLIAGEEQNLVRLLVGQVAHIMTLTGVVHQGLHTQDA